MSKAVDGSKPPLNDFLNTLPSPLLVVLVGLAPPIHRVKRLLEVVSWKSSWEDSWIVLGIWWAMCLLSGIALRYALPLIVLTTFILYRWRTPKDSITSVVVSEDSLHQIINDLTAIHSLLPSVAVPASWNTLTLRILLRTVVILYIPYVILTHFVRLSVLIALAGTAILTWRARWALLIRRGLWRSAYIRWSTYYTWSRVSGQPLEYSTPSSLNAPSLASAASSLGKGAANSQTQLQPEVGHTLRFLFTIYENQRWWMGLDFTAALLPGERPSWCTASQQPVSPPAAFSLPAPTTVYLPDPSRKDGGRMKRTARWSWEESEWRVMVKKEGGPVTRIARPLPSLVEDSATSSAGRILKGVGKIRQSSMSTDGSGTSPERQKEKEDGEAKNNDETEEEEPCTDPDGWIYGDNKWEGGSVRGGMGKYTRYRRWTRIAVLTETIEYVGPGTLGILRSSTILGVTPATVERERTSSISSLPDADTPTPSTLEDDRARLRQRLRAAVKGASHS